MANLGVLGCVFENRIFVQAPCWFINFLVFSLAAAIFLDVVVYIVWPKIKRKNIPSKNGEQIRLILEKDDLVYQVSIDLQKFRDQLHSINIGSFDSTMNQYSNVIGTLVHIYDEYLPQLNMLTNNNVEIVGKLEELHAKVKSYRDKLGEYTISMDEVSDSSQEHKDNIVKVGNELLGRDEESLINQIDSLIDQLVELLRQEQESR